MRTLGVLPQSDRLTLAGLTASAAGKVGVGQVPAPLPVADTDTLTVEVPSVTVTLPPAVAAEGFARRMTSTFPVKVAWMFVVFDSAE